MRIAIIGAGLMGHGIAQVFAVNQHEVTITDEAAAVRDGVLDRIRVNLAELDQDRQSLARIAVCPTIEATVAGADLVVEAIPEDLALKQALFARIEPLVRADAVLATNTSVIRVTPIMQRLAHRGRALATHWWNPPFLVPLVEIIGTEWTDPAVIEAMMALHRSLGQMPVHVKKDVSGSIGNRLQMALWREAIHLVETGVCDAETVDAVVKASFGRRLPVLGPLENADLIGLPLARAIHANVFPTLDARGTPSPLLDRLLAEGKLGMRSGEGLRRWSPEEAEATRKRLARHLRTKLAED
jgi:3-hydroxybutyryl-CoA dehydrogenase